MLQTQAFLLLNVKPGADFKGSEGTSRFSQLRKVEACKGQEEHLKPALQLPEHLVQL